MSVSTVAGEQFLLVRNDGRSAPVIFPGFSNTEDFSWCVWCYPVGNRGGPGIDISIHAGTDGSRILLGHNGYTWAYSSRYGSIGEATIYFDDVVYNRWALFCFVKTGNNIKIYYGLQDSDDLHPETYPVGLRQVIDTTTDVVFDFDYFYLTLGHNQYLSNFKFWNSALTATQLQFQSCRFYWTAASEGFGPSPFWSSPIRTPGDLSSIAYPSTGPNWAALHAYTQTPSMQDLVMGGDPAYMENNFSCMAWIYPIDPDARVNFNPGTSPLVPTTYDSTQFYEFDDRGSITDQDTVNPFTAEYYGWPHPAGLGYTASDSWPLFLNEIGTKITVNHTAANRFEQDTGVVVPNVKATTIYLWKYGAQFTWPIYTPQGPTVTQELSYLYLLVTYFGRPTGVPHLPVADLTGLFAINKGSHVDQYNRGVQLKIPAPTIRTAYIGE